VFSQQAAAPVKRFVTGGCDNQIKIWTCVAC
jgi:hypothetical protein